MLRPLSFFLILLLAAGNLVSAAENTPGATRVARWENNAKGCFLLMFDDSWPSHYSVAVPELCKRKMTATFYINPAKGEYKTKIKEWEGENAVWKKGMAYGNHTMTHDGIQNAEDAEKEISGCTERIKSIIPGPAKRLVSWGQPGVKDWKISKEETEALLKKNHLISRPTFDGHGIVYHLKTAESILALADKAAKEGGMNYAIAHGVERPPEMNWGYQDFWPWKLSQFREVLDGLAARRGRAELWLTDHISYHQYEKERDAAQITVTAVKPQSISVKVTVPALDPELYNYPLTLITAVPPAWKKVKAVQGNKEVSVEAVNGEVMYSAVPGDTPVILQAEK